MLAGLHEVRGLVMEESKDSGLAEFLSDNAERILVGFLALALFAAFLVAVAYFTLFLGPPLNIEPAILGQAGDYFGGILNPVFGFLSVFALLVALVLQTRELKLSRESLALSREELKLSREEQAKAAEALALQNRAIHQQSFEQTFFSMLTLLASVLDSCIAIPNQSVRPETGRQALRAFLQIQPCLTDDDGGVSQFGAHLWREQFLVQDTSGCVTQYARTIRAVIEYLIRSEIEKGEPYPVLLRSQLGQEELRLLCVFCFLEDWSQLKVGVERYGLLAYLRREEAGASVIPLSFFDSSAFDE